MAKRKSGLPPRVRRHGNGFRGVAAILGRRAYGPTFPTVDGALSWLATITATVGRPLMPPLTLEGSLEVLKRDLADAGASKGTVTFYTRAHHELCQVLGGESMLHRIDERAIRHYLDVRKRRGVGLATVVRKEIGTLRRIVRLAMAEGRLGRDPLATVRLPKVRSGRYDVIDAATVTKAIAAIRKENTGHADLVELIWRTSMRRAEVTRLRVDDVDFEGRRIFVHGKTVNRYRPIARELEPVLRRLVGAATEDGRLVSGLRKIENLFTRWGRKLGIPAFSPHVLRHGFASDLLNRGVPAPVVASLMGHSGLRMLDRYFHAQDAALRDAVDSLGQDTQRRPPRPSSATGPGRPAPACAATP